MHCRVRFGAKQGIFYDGQIFDAHKFVSGLISQSRKNPILLIDNYIDETVLRLILPKERRMLL